MKRRDFIRLIGSAAIAGPLAPVTTLAQSSRLFRLGTLGAGPPMSATAGDGAILIDSLSTRGYTLGQNLAFEPRGAAGKKSQLPQLMQELKAAKVDVVVTVSYPAAVAAKASGVPTVIASGSGDPVATGLVDGLSRPGGNVTGISDDASTLSTKRLSLLKSLLPIARRIDAIDTWIGKRLAWLILAAVVVSALNATVRKIFDTSSNSWLELQWVLFSIVFLLCSPWTLLANEHIRIDIVNNILPKRVRDSIDVIGHAFFLMPLAIVMIVTSIPFFYRSIAINEQSGNAGGLPQWPSKSLVLIGFTLLLIQGISELIKRIAVMRDLIPDPHASQVHALEAEVEHIVEAIEKR